MMLRVYMLDVICLRQIGVRSVPYSSGGHKVQHNNAPSSELRIMMCARSRTAPASANIPCRSQHLGGLVDWEDTSYLAIRMRMIISSIFMDFVTPDRGNTEIVASHRRQTDLAPSVTRTVQLYSCSPALSETEFKVMTHIVVMAGPWSILRVELLLQCLTRSTVCGQNVHAVPSSLVAHQC